MIADIHLQPDDAHPINQAFHQFLTTHAQQAAALYILGDCFEMWVGDDVGCKVYGKTLSLFKELTAKGLPIYMMFGNRDFLMRQRFWQITGISHIKEPGLVKIGDFSALICHGDGLCTDDIEFQKMRKILRHPIITWLFLRLPQKKRISIGEGMRAKSQKYNLNKAENIMDVNQQAVEALFDAHPGVTHLIHGHTHRAAHHTYELNSQTFHRWVLGDWRPEMQYLKIQNGEASLHSWSPFG
ncbi:UDP-2,3-diacylglucosamine hydrolase [Thiosulfativibrio zosterae]|uniref:UDP-2,3-diacylglucosamine hydrolase n=1 Tax=Thiosulfativibrio zosterae TaxID=2675053 RepID=A0A6F8PP26_9GAMM|nr:UDP-2,3-diacylglucosamine hydrolase [Thiosulfativibrio zosterae]